MYFFIWANPPPYLDYRLISPLYRLLLPAKSNKFQIETNQQQSNFVMKSIKRTTKKFFKTTENKKNLEVEKDYA